MAENAIDPMKIDELQAKLAQAREIILEASLALKNSRLEEKNKEVEELQKLNEERQKTIDSLIEENEKLRERLGEKETESVLAQNKVKKLEREIAESKTRQERASRNIKTDVEVEELEGDEENTLVLILGGLGPLTTIYLLDSKAQSWKELRITLPKGMYSFGAIVLKEEIYIFGGVDKDYKQDCYKLKDDGSWMQLAPLNQKRAYISSSSLVYKGEIWAIGGYSGEYLKSVEKYDISQDKWTYMPKMNYKRSNAAAAVFKDRIFVTGGWNGERLKSVEMLDPILQKWILFCNLPFELVGHTMLISNSTLSIFGGYSGSDILNSVWEMDIEDPEKKWTEKQSFKHLRKHFGIGKLSNGIIVFGDETSEIFDGNKWIDGPELPIRLACFAYTLIPRSIEERLLMKFA